MRLKLLKKHPDSYLKFWTASVERKNDGLTYNQINRSLNKRWVLLDQIVTTTTIGWIEVISFPSGNVPDKITKIHPCCHIPVAYHRYDALCLLIWLLLRRDKWYFIGFGSNKNMIFSFLCLENLHSLICVFNESQLPEKTYGHFAEKSYIPTCGFTTCTGSPYRFFLFKKHWMPKVQTFTQLLFKLLFNRMLWMVFDHRYICFIKRHDSY